MLEKLQNDMPWLKTHYVNKDMQTVFIEKGVGGFNFIYEYA